MLDDRDGGGPAAAAAAYAADHELAAERKAGGAGVDGDAEAVAIAKDPQASVAGGAGVDEKAQGGKKTKMNGGPISWLFGD